MAEPNQRDQKLIQYLNEAHAKEKELEQALTAHVGMTTRPPYKKRLQQHLRETKSHAKQLERRVKKLGGSTSTVGQVAKQATALAKGPLHALRGTGDAERLLKNAKSEYHEEAEEIATYRAIEVFAEAVGDAETAKLAKSIRREEERMAKYLEGLIPQLAKAVVRDEVPSDQRATRRRRTTRRSGARKSSGSRKRTSSSSRGRRRTSSSSRSRSRASSSSRGSSTRSGSSRSRSRASGSRSGSSRSRRGGGSRRRRSSS